MTWLRGSADGATSLQQALGLRPELKELFGAYLAQAWADNDPVLIELCRLRIAKLHGDDAQQRLRHTTAMDAGLTESKIAELSRYHSSSRYSAHERHCLNYAEKYVIDVHSITDADADTVKEAMADDEFVAFTVALGLFDGIGRFRLALGLGAGEPAEVTVVPTPSATAAAH